MNASTLPEVLHVLGQTAPSRAEAETVRDADIAETFTVPDAVVAS